MTELRQFLAGLEGAAVEPVRVPPELYRLAARVTRRGELADDLVQDLVLDLLYRTRRAQAGGIHELLKLGDQDLLAAIRRRLIQTAAASRGARWALVKQVRAHVRAALSGPLPPVVAAPTSVVAGGRIHAKLVAVAAAWYLQQPGQDSRDAKAIAAWILGEYLRMPSANDLPGSDTDGGTDFQQVEAALDAPSIAADLRALLGPDQARVVALRAAGASLQVIADTQGCAVSSAHARTSQAVEQVAERAKAAGWSGEAMCLAFGLLEAA